MRRNSLTLWRHALPVAAGVALATTLSGCSGVITTGIAIRHPSTFVAVGPGLWVVADYDYPVYYYGDFYWTLYDGTWYRRAYIGDPWVRIGRARVPSRVVGVRHNRYIRYHPPARRRVWDVRRGNPPARGRRVRRR